MLGVLFELYKLKIMKKLLEMIDKTVRKRDDLSPNEFTSN